jgi:hypothetical protein
MSLLESVRLPYCEVLMTEAWNAAPGRYYAAFRSRHGFRWMLGHLVLEEFGTVSSPLFLAPRALLGQIYDAGITLAHRRGSELDLDMGWPPLCIGLERPAVSLPEGWQAQLLAALAARAPAAASAPLPVRTVDGYTLTLARDDAHTRASSVSVLATSAPLLPAQLRRLCDLDDRGLSLALALGNRVTRQSAAQAQEIAVLAEGPFARLAAAASELYA